MAEHPDHVEWRCSSLVSYYPRCSGPGRKALVHMPHRLRPQMIILWERHKVSIVSKWCCLYLPNIMAMLRGCVSVALVPSKACTKLLEQLSCINISYPEVGWRPPDELPLLSFPSLELTSVAVYMSTTTPPNTENDPKRPISLLSLGKNIFVIIISGMLTSCIDAGGPQGLSQLLILKDVMERLSKDENGDSQGIVKRPCEVFDMIGGVGTGGSVLFTFCLRFTYCDSG
jgi:hypothetical protein